MATATHTAIYTVPVSDAAFVAYGEPISLGIQAMGLVKTTDTGQINWATPPATANSSDAGYEMFRFDDALQASRPVFIKVVYGRMNAGGSNIYPRISFAVGTATNGAGTLTNAATTGNWESANTDARTWYMSGSPERLTFAYHSGAGSTFVPVVSIERTKDVTGSPTADGILFLANSVAGAASSAFVPYDGTPPITRSLWPTFPANFYGRATVGLDVIVSQPFYCYGKYLTGSGILTMASGQTGGYLAEFNTSVYGSAKNYKVFGTNISAATTSFTGGYTSTGTNGFAMRYE